MRLKEQKSVSVQTFYAYYNFKTKSQIHIFMSLIQLINLNIVYYIIRVRNHKHPNPTQTFLLQLYVVLLGRAQTVEIVADDTGRLADDAVINPLQYLPRFANARTVPVIRAVYCLRYHRYTVLAFSTINQILFEKTPLHCVYVRNSF